MEIKAQLKYLRIAPRKVRMVADMVRGENAQKAVSSLAFSLKRGSQPTKKLLESALANAKNNYGMVNTDGLYIKRITVDEAPKLKRWRARAKGRAMQIQKKSCHINIMLGESVAKKKAESKTKKNVS